MQSPLCTFPHEQYTIEIHFLFGVFLIADKQNELELPLPPSKARERKRRHQHQHQQQQQLLMSHISGVRKVTHGPSITGGCSVARFGVKTDMEDLLSKVKRPVVG